MNFDEEDFEYEKKEINKESGFLEKNIDNMIKKKIDNKRIKNIDKTKKRAVIEAVFDERTIWELGRLIKNDIIHHIEGIISAGKEANVYLGYDCDEKEIALKIYKIDNNISKWMRNYIIGDPRFKNIPNNTSKIIYLWATKEYKNLKRAYKSDLKVPKPIYVKKNILIMEYIGIGPNPAPRLKDIKNPPNIGNIMENILQFIKILYQKANLVHGDLSEFNILFHNQTPIMIDISQGVSIHHPKAEIFLVRDIKNIFNYFEKFEIVLPDPETFYYEIIKTQK
ncbi:MAG: serine protein kinase RIO [Candidatus Lokiarchaeota archaeon]|nr:serine protein kinase RIO [Candidatus Lokiarchaeota archaeon]